MEAREVRVQRLVDRRHALAFVVALTACGYRPLRSGLKGSPRIRVVSSQAVVAGNAHAWLAEEIATGARGELAKYGALAGEDATDRLKLEVVRLDELSEGVEVVEGKPRARGVRVRLTARGVIEGASGSWETSDIEATEMVATSGDALAWDAARGAAARGLARRAGALIAREILGIP
jgi:hypothetical protein